MDWYKATQGHNGILINDQGQVQTSAGWGYIARFVSGKNISYASGEASPAYNHGNNADLVKTFKRHLLMLHPQPIIVIYDELEVTQESTFSWLIHSYKKIIIENNKWLSTENEMAKGWVYLDGSHPLEFEVTDQFAVEPVNFRRKEGGDNLYPKHWHFKAENKSKSRKMRFLAIIQIATDDMKPKLVVNEKGEFLLDDWQIVAQLDVEQQANLQVKNNDDLAAFTSSGILKWHNKSFSSAKTSQATLVEIVDGKEVVKSADNIIPNSFYEAFRN